MKLTMMVGVPGSGKTTMAKNMALSQGNTRLVSRDDFRAMLFPEKVYKFTEEKEDLVSVLELRAVEDMLLTGKNVIVHDTNLKPRDLEHWKAVAKSVGADFEEKVVECHIVELLKRNHTRGDKALPVRRVWEMYKGFRIRQGWRPAIEKADPNLPKCVIFDVDGTLVKMGQRSPYDFTKVKDDPANPPIIELFKMYQEQGYACIVVSGRTGTVDCYNDTWESLTGHGADLTEMYMRGEKDKRHDFDVKEQILLEQILKKYYPVLAVDDRDTPVGMWRMNGIPCLQVNYGDF